MYICFKGLALTLDSSYKYILAVRSRRRCSRRQIAAILNERKWKQAEIRPRSAEDSSLFLHLERRTMRTLILTAAFRGISLSILDWLARHHYRAYNNLIVIKSFNKKYLIEHQYIF